MSSEQDVLVATLFTVLCFLFTLMCSDREGRYDVLFVLPLLPMAS